MLQKEVSRRNIRRVVHFTKVQNLPSIFRYGLMPKDFLEEAGVPYSHNDETRADGHTDASCLSICTPNYKIFHTYRAKDDSQKWAVLSFKTDILWEKMCAFSYRNTDSSEISMIPIEDRIEPEAFLGMFNEYEQYPNRSILGIPLNYPTNPQAEILVFDEIELSYLQAVYFSDIDTKNKYRPIGPNKIIYDVDNDYFDSRLDHKHWIEPSL
jgi:hypothetical protein